MSVEADNRAIGWLVGSLERDHPGYVEDQAAAAEAAGYHDVASALRNFLTARP